ncbi:MAG TPA: diacylglycerol kinase family protein [Polyangiaceae bacterium]|nr:diacylglycerol kinase family protein [Polyangiaceae bacterium]
MTDDERSAVTPAAPVPSASDRIAVVVNGNAKSVTDEVISTLDQILLGGDLFVSRQLEDSSDIAKTLLSRGYGTVLTGGGDGTFTVMVSAIVREAREQGKALPRFGLLKLGTGNALAWVVGASRAKGRGLAADIQRLREDAGSRHVRLVEVDGFLTPFAGFGVDAVVLRDYTDVKALLMKTPLRRYAAGPLSYALGSITRSIPSYFFRPEPHCRITNEGGDAFRMGDQGQVVGPPIPRGEVIYEGPAKVAGLGSIPYYGFGFRFFPFADERDDRMHLRVSTIGPVKFVANFPGIWRGEFHDPNVVFDYLVEAVRMEMDPPTEFQIGGDPRGVHAEVSARLSPEALRLVDFYAPPRP